MSTAERAYDRAVRRAFKAVAQLAADAREARLMAAASQAHIGKVAHCSPSKVSRFESGGLRNLTIVDAFVLADAAGLDLSMKTYPGRGPTRDAGHARRLNAFLGHVGRPLMHRREALLPPNENVPERRAWDALIWDAGGETGVELEQRLYDVQSQARRIFLKWRDSGVERLLLVIADTATNRRVLKEFGDYFSDLPRLRTATVLRTLEEGRRPDSGLILF